MWAGRGVTTLEWVLRLATALMAALALAATVAAATPTKRVRAGHVAMRLPASWIVHRDVAPLLLVGVAPRSAGGKRTNVTVAEAPRAPGDTLRTWRWKLVRGLSALQTGL